MEFAVTSVMGSIESVNVFHMAITGGGPVSTTDLATSAADVSAAFIAHLQPPLSSDIGVLSVKATDLTSQTAGTHTFNPTGNGGSGAVPAASPGVAVDVSWGTSGRGRSYRGRSYLMGIPRVDALETGALDGTFHTAMTTGATAFITALRAAPHPDGLVIASRFLNRIARSAILATRVEDATVRLNTKSQRRRNPKG